MSPDAGNEDAGAPRLRLLAPTRRVFDGRRGTVNVGADHSVRAVARRADHWIGPRSTPSRSCRRTGVMWSLIVAGSPIGRHIRNRKLAGGIDPWMRS
jgi:hypothetical protein